MRTCAATLLLLVAAVQSAFCQSQTIDFSEYAGPTRFSAVQPPLQAGVATLSGGQILTNATNAPADEGTIYGTADFCSGCLQTITIDFAVAVSAFSAFIINGNVVTVTYTVADNQGGSQTITLVANFDSGAGTVTLPDSNITQVTVTAGSASGGPGWDFAIGSLVFSPAAPVLVDPVPGPSCAGTCLLNGPAVTTNTDILATQGTVVQSIAADGVAQVVVRIPATAGQQMSLTLVPTTSNTAIGALADPLTGGSFGAGPLTVTAVDTAGGPMAFALYQAPLDFSQGGDDDQASQRTVSLRTQIGIGPISTTTITILRPPVILVHGLWDSSVAWANFTPALTSGTQKFFVRTANYSDLLTGITAASPTYTTAQLTRARASALGFAYNAPNVLNQINQIITDFKTTNGAAAVQADIVAHSMGGDITRSLRAVSSFASSSNFGKGGVHKLITIGTPHLGSPLATQLLQTSNVCVAGLLAGAGNISFSTVTLSAGGTVTGGVGDLQGNGTGGGLSLALTALQSSFVIPFPTALIAGTINSTNLNGLNCSFCAAGYIRYKCGGTKPGDPLAQNLTATSWPTVLGGPSDSVVPYTSELNNTALTSAGMSVNGVIHSLGMEQLSFVGPAELDTASGIATQVIVLLNEFLTGVDYHRL